MKLRLLALLCGGLALTGCASMNESECLTADWNGVGYQDGAKGQSSDGIARYRKSCAKHGVSPDLQAYLTGWEDGVIRFCTPQNGFDAGSRGQRYQGVCPADIEPDFLLAFSDGSHLYKLTSAVHTISSDISRDERHLQRVEEDIARKEAKLISSEGEIADRVQLLADIKRLAEERGELRRAVVNSEYELGRAEVELEHYRSDIALQYGL